MKRFARLSEIQPNDAASWEDKLFLTFDIDWACDDVLSYSIDMVEQAGVAATWFVTHDTPLLKRLRDNPLFELGIHPNFNFLLNGDMASKGNAKAIVADLLNIVPGAKSVRSHAMTQNSLLLDLFVKNGLTHDSNHFIPEQAGISLKPWYLWNGIIKVPYCWEDDVACIYTQNSPISEVMQRPGLRVFDFHPIHIYLNTEDLARYENSRAYHRDVAALAAWQNNVTPGARNWLISLLEG